MSMYGTCCTIAYDIVWRLYGIVWQLYGGKTPSYAPSICLTSGWMRKSVWETMFKKTKSAKASDHDDYEDAISSPGIKCFCISYLNFIFEFNLGLKKHNLKVPVSEKAESEKSLWKLLPHSDSTMAGKNYYLIPTPPWLVKTITSFRLVGKSELARQQFTSLAWNEP